MASHPASTQLRAYYEESREDPDSNVLLKLFVLFLGVAVGAMIPLGIWLAASAQNAKNDAQAAAAKVSAASSGSGTATSSMGATSSAAGSRASASFAGIAPANADTLAMKHAAAPATLPAAPAGPVRTEGDRALTAPEVVV